MAAEADKLAWQLSEDSGGARLVLGIPETDAIQVTGVCAASTGPTSSKLTFSADIGSLSNGKETLLRFSGDGIEHNIKGHVQRAEGEAGLTGVAANLEHSDALWTMLEKVKALEYVVPGHKSSDLPLETGRANIQKFVAACRAYAAKAGPQETGPQEKGAADASAEKDAFNSAKELGTADAWNAFLSNYPKGFRADLARAYLKKLEDGEDTAKAAPAKLETVTATERACRDRSKLRSESSDGPARIKFRNVSGMYRSIMWIDFDGTTKDYGGLNAGEELVVETFVTHPWMVATGPGDCIQIFMPGAGEADVKLLRASVDDGPKKTEPAKSKPVTTKKSPLDYARENCKETGGYWTGKTCKASKNAKVGKCKPGYVWSSEAGACQWDGGPPKKANPQQQQGAGEQIQQLIQGIQNAGKQSKCKAPRTWDAASQTCDCPGDSVFKGGKCIKENVP